MSPSEFSPQDQVPAGPELPPQTAPENISVRLDGFADSSFAEKCGHAIGDCVRLISHQIKLERLDGITVAYDYDTALETLDRGYSTTQRLIRTSNDLLVGVAMTVAVVRNGIIKAHMVFHAQIAANLLSENIEHQRFSVSLIAHECGHVETVNDLDNAFPGALLNSSIPIKNYLLQPVSEIIWEEYSACRLSALFGKDEQTSTYQESLVRVLLIARERANSAIRDYRLHGDLDRVLREAGPYIWEPLRIGSYLLGHLDGLGLDIDSAPDAKEALAATGYSDCVFTLWRELQQLWDEKGRWNSLSRFHVLIDVLENTMADRGMIFCALDGSRYRVDIPMTPEETTPI